MLERLVAKPHAVSSLPDRGLQAFDRSVELTVEAPAGSRHKGYEEIIVQDLSLA